MNRFGERDAAPAAMQKAMLSLIRLPVTAVVSNLWLRGSEAGETEVKFRSQLENTVSPASASRAAPCVLHITGRAGYAVHSPFARSTHRDFPFLRAPRRRGSPLRYAVSACASIAHTLCSSQQSWHPGMQRISLLYNRRIEEKNESQYEHRVA